MFYNLILLFALLAHPVPPIQPKHGPEPPHRIAVCSPHELRCA